MTISPDFSPAEIAALLAQARVEARSAQLAAAPGPAELAFRQAMAEVNATRTVSYHWPLIPSSLYDRLPLLFNRLVRRYLRWYVGRIVEQQNAANEAIAHSLELLAANNRDLHGS